MPDDESKNLPSGANAFIVSYEIQESASRQGFDWPEISGVLDKVREELDEVAQALKEDDRAQAQRELGDLLFASVNLARFLGTTPWECLQDANSRFRKRFLLLKTELERRDRVLDECTFEELNLVWDEVKARVLRNEKKA